MNYERDEQDWQQQAREHNRGKEAILVPYTTPKHHEHLPATILAVTIASQDSSAIEETFSTYNIFWRKSRRHFIKTPLDCPERDRPWQKPRFKPGKGEDGDLKAAPIDVLKDDLPPDLAANTFYVHHPYISFHNPPRTFRYGGTKNSPTLASINNSWFWRKWTLQFGCALADDGVVDPRGALSLLYTASKNHVGKKAAKGHRVRKWRLWERLANNVIMISMPVG
ncbi:hypothetical protein FKW77_005736 [Venturia effusa]|uniref:Uncharacterized protein n=1 Tax=Venturia effusa TaxID=50376 RepID=A0A517LH95_9PEZI|nr:hypothetical protein FKW77_005736 [Venturia effusa]